jgi:hypothetical protein
VLIQVKAHNLPTVREFFGQLDYREKRLMDVVGVEGSLENVILVPASSSNTDATSSPSEV